MHQFDTGLPVARLVCAGIFLLTAWGCAAVPQLPFLEGRATAAPALTPQLAILDGKRSVPTIAPEIYVDPPKLVWEDLRQGMRLDHHLDNRWVRAELRWLQRNPEYFQRLAPRFAKYQAYINRAVAERGLPAELALLPIVESALNPYAMSPDGAHGLWQFMPATAGRFGLTRDWWQDARRDPIRATDAALDYLEILYKRFGDWKLAVAAYNTGEGNLRKALRRAQRSHGHPVKDFFLLRLPRETRSYVPRLLAVAAAVRAPGDYGLELPAVRDGVPFDVVRLDSQYDLSVAAEALTIEGPELRAWNPALKQWATPPLRGDQGYALIVPKRLPADAHSALAAVASGDRLRWHQVTVRQGDTLSGIARRYGTTTAAVRSSNNLRSDLIRANTVLRVPAGGQVLASAEQPQTHAYRVRQGDNLWTIGRKFGVSHKTLMRLNGIGPRELLRIGQRLQVPYNAVASVPPSSGRRVGASGQPSTHTYRVRQGDNLWTIGRKFGVSHKTLMRLNGIGPRELLRIGQRIQVPYDGAGNPSSFPAAG